MSSCVWMSRAQLRTLIETFDSAEYPILIHCQWGAERTGLASAFAELLRPGSTLEDARRQFSIRYLFVRVNDGKIMAEHLDQYERWLAASGLTHTPATFRRWVEGRLPADGAQPRAVAVRSLSAGRDHATRGGSLAQAQADGCDFRPDATLRAGRSCKLESPIPGREPDDHGR